MANPKDLYNASAEEIRDISLKHIVNKVYNSTERFVQHKTNEHGQYLFSVKFGCGHTEEVGSHKRTAFGFIRDSIDVEFEKCFEC